MLARNKRPSYDLWKISGYIFVISSILNFAIAIFYFILSGDLPFLILYLCGIIFSLVEGIWLIYIYNRSQNTQKIYSIGVGLGIILFVILIPFFGFALNFVRNRYDFFYSAQMATLMSILINSINNENNIFSVLLNSNIDLFPQIKFYGICAFDLGFGIFLMILVIILNYIGMVKSEDMDFSTTIKNPPRYEKKYFHYKRKYSQGRRSYSINYPEAKKDLNIFFRTEPPPPISEELHSRVEMSDGAYLSAMKILEKKDLNENPSGSEVYSKVHMKKPILNQSKDLICPNCSQPNFNYARICKFCGAEFQKCSICGKNLGKEDIVYCPFCNATYHKTEFLEWLKVKACCKSYNREIDMWEFQKYLEEHEQVQKDSLKVCQECKKAIPNDAIYCIYCGIKNA